MELQPGTVIDGRYVLGQLIGKGGMGSVWLCRHAKLGSPYAIKFLRPDLAADESARTRFELEAHAAAALRTRHAVQVHDHGVDGDHAFLVMELLEGEDLRGRLQRLGRLSLGAARDVVVQTARGLQHAHEAGIVHRDLKPANIFLAQADGEETVKVLDFGIAKLIDAPHEAMHATQTGAVLGSPHYMSPEQIRGHWSQVDHRTDLWALAVVAFRALTGQMPFIGDTLGDVMVKVCIDPHPVASQIAPKLPSALDGFFERALARDREKRFRSGYELALAFCRALGDALPPPDPRWSLPSDDSWDLQAAETAVMSLSSPTAETRRVDDDDARTTRVDVGGEDATTLAVSEGTLTEAGSLQLRARDHGSSRSLALVVFAGVALLAAVAIGGMALAQQATMHPLRLMPAFGELAKPTQSPQVVSTSVGPAPSPPASTTASAAAASAASAEPSSSTKTPLAKPTRPGPPARGKPKSGFKDRFGYE